MNHLAHFFLSCENDDLLIGNFIADYIRNKEVINYSDEVQAGILLHRKIDSFTDTHSVVRQGTRRLRKYHGKYAPVILDILYDYILVRNWSLYSGQPLEDFTSYVYGILWNRMEKLPAKLQTRLPNMINDNWLIKYGTEAGLLFVFEKMDERTKFPSDFKSAIQHFKMDYHLYEEEFKQFFPKIIQYVEQECIC